MRAGDVVVSAHACGGLTDEVLGLRHRGARRAWWCCRAARRRGRAISAASAGWIDGALAIDVTRAARLRAHGYTVYTQTIPAEITPKNRLLLGAPPGAVGAR